MLRRLVGQVFPPVCLILLFSISVRAAIWPDQLAGFAKTASQSPQLADKAIWDEYGLQDSEQAEYASGAKHFSAAAFRLKDSTGAFAAFEWQRPAGSRPSKIASLAAETPDKLLLAYGNYLLEFNGAKPQAAELTPFLEHLSRLDQGPLPLVSGYLPAPALIPNSERYVLGPESLARFAPQIPPSVAAFHLGAEGHLGRFRSKNGELNLAIFSYPTPQIARARLKEFEKLPSTMAKRTGPLIAVALSPSDPDQAEKLLAQVNYQATITWDEYVPTRRDNIGVLVINCFILIGILLGFCAVAGLAFGGLRAISRRAFGLPETPDPIIRLRLGDR